MNIKPSLCAPDRVTAFLNETMISQERAAFEKHLDECEVCREALDAAVASPQDWSELRTSLSGGDDSTQHDADRDRADLGYYRKLLGPTDDPRMLGRIGSYEIVGVLGRGGMGIVFKGLDPSLNRYVAIKLLAPNIAACGASRQRFLREAQSAAAVAHEHVVAIHGISQWQDTPYLVMEYVRGESLQKRLHHRGPLRIQELLRIGMQVASGLAAAHGQGLIHRDIKPGNILLETDIDRVRITDFGLARAVDDIRLTRTDLLLGTPQYMSPEQARDEPLDFRSDLFSLGVVLYEAATGRAPFQAATSYGALRKIVDHRPTLIRELNADVPEWFDNIVSRLMAKEPSDRFQSAHEVAELLKQCLAHVEQPQLVPLPESIRPLPVNTRNTHWRKLFTPRRMIVTTSILAVLALSSWMMFAPGDTTQDSTTAQESSTEADSQAAGGSASASASAGGSASASASENSSSTDSSRSGSGEGNVRTNSSTNRSDRGGRTTRTRTPRATNEARNAPDIEESEDDGDQLAAMATGKAGDYTISIRKIGEVDGQRMDMQFDMSKLDAKEQGQAFGDNRAGGFGGGVAGGSGGSFIKPNFGLALTVDSRKKNDNLVELSPNATAIDDQGRRYEAKSNGTAIVHFPEFENLSRGKYLYFSGWKRDWKSIYRLEGELIVTPGRELVATFNGPKFNKRQTKRVDGETFTLHSVTKNDDGISISVTCPQTMATTNAQTPQERFAALVGSRGAYSAEIIDSYGEVHRSNTSGSSGASGSSSFSSSSGPSGNRASSNDSRTFGFAPLPEDREIQAVRLRMIERTGEPKAIPFKITNIENPVGP